MSSPTWTPTTIANGIIRLAAGLMILCALGLGAITVGSWLWTKATAPKVQIKEFPPGFSPPVRLPAAVDWSTPKTDRIESVIPYRPSGR